MSGTVEIRVPASTSNVGSGFDCIGVAVGRWIRLSARLGGEGGDVRIARSGALAEVDVPPEEDCIYRGFVAACGRGDRRPTTGLWLDATSDIPVGRGLGASGAATVAGALAANRLLGLGLSDDELLEICAQVEGHPDNVAPAIRGGATVTLQDATGRLSASRLMIHRSVGFVIAIPSFRVETDRARAALPHHVPHSTARAAVQRGMALIRGLATGDPAFLSLGLQDVLHVPFREALVPGYAEVVAAARAAGAYGATLSGAGSAVLALADPSDLDRVGSATVAAWAAKGVTAEFLSSPRPVAGYQISRAGRSQPSGQRDAAERAPENPRRKR